MTPVDISNRNTILDLIEKNMGYDDNSISFFRNQLYNPIIDDAFKEGLGPDLRKRWTVDFSTLSKEEEDFLKQNDLGYKIFKAFFMSFANEISYSEFQNNIKVNGKSKIKIKKYIENIYKNDEERYKNDKDRRATKYVYRIEEKTIERYIVKAFEYIGKYKTPNKKMEIVLSLNFADWLLCSTAESWSSCFSLESGCYWFGVPGLIGDLSRALLYITNGNKKTYLGITVDSVISRSWVLLGEDNKKYIVKFYPNKFFNTKMINKITGDNSYYYIDDCSHEEIKAKNDFNLLFFKKKIAYTAYNDRSKIEIINKKPVEKIMKTAGIQAFSKSYKDANIDFGQAFLKELISEKKQFNQLIRYTPQHCSICCSSEDDDFYYDPKNGRNICKKCFKERYYACDKCGSIHEKTSLKEYRGKFYDQKCYNEIATIKCEYCSKDVTIRNTFNHNGKIICALHKDEMKKCLGCDRKFFKEEMIKIHDTKKNGKSVLRLRCPDCFRGLSKTVIKCEKCGEFYTGNRKMGEDKICDKCKESKN